MHVLSDKKCVMGSANCVLLLPTQEEKKKRVAIRRTRLPTDAKRIVGAGGASRRATVAAATGLTFGLFFIRQLLLLQYWYQLKYQ